jgi:pimeloyl-ACP methyl ester carboxylesterase
MGRPGGPQTIHQGRQTGGHALSKGFFPAAEPLQPQLHPRKAPGFSVASAWTDSLQTSRARKMTLHREADEPIMDGQIVFCHGCPGSPRDADLACPPEWRVSAPDFLTTRDPVGAGIRAVSDAAQATGKKVTLVGFSIGAMLAIKIARGLPQAVGALVLLSPAAPLQLGDYLGRMSGRAVFDLARKRPGALGVLAFAQSLAVRAAPDAVLQHMFREVSRTERQLLANTAFRRQFVASLASSLGIGRTTYAELLRSYVADWRSTPQASFGGQQDDRNRLQRFRTRTTVREQETSQRQVGSVLISQLRGTS